MKVYQPDAPNGRRTVFVTPGSFYPTTEWVDAAGKPVMFQAVFVHGVADVPDNLGQYMIDHGLAQRSPIILPAGVTS